MAGVKGRSGRRRLPVEHHLLNGTFRPDRHGPRPKVGTPATGVAETQAAPSKVGPPDTEAAILEGLGEAGQALIRDVQASLTVKPCGYAVLRMAGTQADRAAEARALIASEGLRSITGTLNPLLRVERAAVASMLACLRAIGLPPAVVERVTAPPDDPFAEFAENPLARFLKRPTPPRSAS